MRKVLVRKARVAHPSWFHGSFRCDVRRFALEVDVWRWQRGSSIIVAFLFEGFFLLPVIALGVIKDVGYRAGFLRDGLRGLQVLGFCWSEVVGPSAAEDAAFETCRS